MGNIKKSTIVRTVALAIVLINYFLKASGRQIIEIDEGSIEAFVEMIVSASIIVLTWWCNNSFTKEAIKADAYLEKLRELEGEEYER